MLQLGSLVGLTGNVTTLQWIGAKSPANVAKSLGFGPSILAAGYWIAVLKDPLSPSDFDFDGNTLRSGGRVGKPADNKMQDAARPRVHDLMIGEYGATAYGDMQKAALQRVSIIGPERIAKVIPMSRVESGVPAIDYPMGGGGLQWTLKEQEQLRTFLIAVEVDRNGLATCANGEAASVADDAPYDGRQRVYRYLATA